MEIGLIIFSVLLVSIVSLVGIVALVFNARKFDNLLFLLVSFSTGALFGDVFFHLLPESIEESGFSLSISLSILFGIAVSFIIEKIIQWRHCHAADEKSHAHPFAYMNLWGDGVHNFIDGLIIGASYLASVPTGIATTMAVIFHEIPQEIGDAGVLLKGGLNKNNVILFNFLTALTAVLGALVAISIGSGAGNVSTFLVPFAAGNFIYIAGSDLIPELHKETKVKNSLMQLIALILGLFVMYLLLLVGG